MVEHKMAEVSADWFWYLNRQTVYGERGPIFRFKAWSSHNKGTFFFIQYPSSMMDDPSYIGQPCPILPMMHAHPLPWQRNKPDKEKGYFAPR